MRHKLSIMLFMSNLVFFTKILYPHLKIKFKYFEDAKRTNSFCAKSS